jgi:hypothetical protein
MFRTIATWVVLVAAFLRPLRTTAATVDYVRDIKPLLEKRCYSCHSRLKQKSDLRVDAGALIHRGGKNGPIIIPGHAPQSELLKRVMASNEDERMPPEGKPLAAAEVDLLKNWIDAGAPYPKEEAIPPLPSEHWAFQPVRRPDLPAVKKAGWTRNPIDHFVLAKLEARGWEPAREAEPRSLLRRVYLDLIGLPPTPEEQNAFLRQPTAENLDRVIDELLRRPHYGERWARHWLDVVRYADSNGYERDAEKPFVWRYRDYVIRAFNADTPYDRFVLEQLAGDELPEANGETWIATGLHRLGHWDDEPADPEMDRFDQLDDIVSTTAQAFLGLTLGCARCHDHKFEPLTTRDYYSMVAVFHPLKRPQKGRTELTLPAGTAAEIAAQLARDEKIAQLRKQTNTLTTVEIEQQIQSLRDATPDLPQGYFFNESAQEPPKTHVLLRGNPKRRGEEAPPAVPAILVKHQPEFPKPGDRSARRRLGLARWIASHENPLTARVMVNRVWQQHFGAGLVRTPNDFGIMGEEPTHPELLDWLAHWFTHEGRWSLKALHRLILTSRTWRMSRDSNPAYAAADPENRLLWRIPYRRLEVEALRDSMLAVSGQLNPAMFGRGVFLRIPQAALEANTDKESIWKPSPESETARRSIYAFVKRGLVVPMFEVLDLCDTVHSSPQRTVTTVAPQALTLFNGAFVNDQARHLAARLKREAGDDPPEQIELAYQLALCRPPTQAESTALLEFLNTEGKRRQQENAASNGASTEDVIPSKAMAMEQACRVILNLNEFAYPD